MAHPAYDVIVIGEGVSGLTAAGALAGAGLKVATLEAQLFGGLIINVNELEPAPQGASSSGAELASELMQANAEAGVASIQEEVTGLSLGAGAKQIVTASGTHTAKAIVVATGARLKKLGVPGEAEFEGSGVSQCADCDGPMYQNEDVIVVGGGDSALQEALVLAQYARRVHLVHRRAEFRGSAHFGDKVRANDRISIIWNATVEAILGSKMVDKVQVKHDGRVQELPCAGVFAYIGLAPNTAFLPGEVKRDERGGIITDNALETTVPGVWAIGAARSGYAGTLEEAIAEGRRVAATLKQRLA